MPRQRKKGGNMIYSSLNKIVIKLAVMATFMQMSFNCFADTALTREEEIKDIPWEQRTYEDKVMHSSYEDHYTFKHGKPYILDPWTWGYTKEFADRFRMPKQWIEPGLKGALAVAFRMTTIGNTMCGYGKKEDSCWKPLNCQLDVYYDNKLPIPWVKPEITKDNRMQGLSSGRFLEIVPKQFTKELPPPTGGPVGGTGVKSGKYNVGGYLLYFDQNFQEGVGLISSTGVCPSKDWANLPDVHMDFPNVEDLTKYGQGKLKQDDIRIEHRIDFPKSLIQRMNAIYEVQNKPNDAVMDGLLKGFFEQRKQQKPVTK
jgi:hypothetical protein